VARLVLPFQLAAMAYESRFAFSVCPLIRADEDHLTASTHWLVRILSLGLLFRRMVVDRRARTVTIDERTACFFRRRRVFSFAQVAAVTYGYEDVHPAAMFSGTHDAMDRYIVGLRIAGSDEVRLFYFLGDGAFTNEGPLPDWWYWDEYTMDFTGSQERESRAFVQLLSKLIGVTIMPSTLTPE
jgi:hypothetical protein